MGANGKGEGKERDCISGVRLFLEFGASESSSKRAWLVIAHGVWSFSLGSELFVLFPGSIVGD